MERISPDLGFMRCAVLQLSRGVGGRDDGLQRGAQVPKLGRDFLLQVSGALNGAHGRAPGVNGAAAASEGTIRQHRVQA
jgi:hypothetical protein